MSYDCFIFDMDGTLWDAVDSYAAIWNRTIEELGCRAPAVTRRALVPLMGVTIDGIYDTLVGGHADPDVFLRRLKENEIRMMPGLGGVLYPGVRETLTALARRGASLMMVSNCGAEGLPNFLRFTGLEPLISDWRAFGANGLPKEENIRALTERYKPERPVYVGDTPGDCRSAHLAGIPFAWAAYGFGQNPGTQEHTLQKIGDLLTL